MALNLQYCWVKSILLDILNSILLGMLNSEAALLSPEDLNTCPNY